MIAAVALSPSLDVTYEVDRLQRGGIARPVRVTRVPGGKALNMARVAAAVGADVRAIAPLGGGIGREIAAMLEHEPLEATVVETSGETRTCIAIVERDGGASSTDIYERSAPFSAPDWTACRAAVAELRDAQPTWIALAGSVPDGVPLPDLAEALSLGASTGARIGLDASGAVLRELIPVASLVKVNRAEAEELIGEPLADAGTACAALADRWMVDSVVTDGIAGAAALIAGVEYAVPPPTAPGRFSAGSGDAFFGGLLASLDRGSEVEVALRSARDAAERNAAVPGAGRLVPPGATDAPLTP
ncbi:1-phosphofructokinase family hexose kinase [Agromyces marinus]|uniref:Tagatose-6-phosphate kinase n=1 Tax=Agromyces marinus TaxID=1389020 RepID=A0ABM8H121_9MICO|nr:PfkB family carbohydrate kinase [Agromyces marinus]UIP57428.1 Tagatose-6-phosphate kinase [Agromyces marinus]BDZ54449.1 tagatose-6-phosphate kinase [Agromyces marinus]